MFRPTGEASLEPIPRLQCFRIPIYYQSGSKSVSVKSDELFKPQLVDFCVCLFNAFYKKQSAIFSNKILVMRDVIVRDSKSCFYLSF